MAQLPQMRSDLAILPKLSNQIVDIESKVRNLATHDEDQAAQMKRLADSFQQSVDQLRDRFQESLEKQRAEHRRALEDQELRWRQAQERTEQRWQEAQKKVIDETVQQIGLIMARSISARVAPWLWAILVSAVATLATWFWTKLTR